MSAAARPRMTQIRPRRGIGTAAGSAPWSGVTVGIDALSRLGGAGIPAGLGPRFDTSAARGKYPTTRFQLPGRSTVANHLTPSELAEELHMKRQEVIGKCVQMGIPIFHGRIDKSLFQTSLRTAPGQ